ISNVNALLEEVCRERMPERVRRHDTTDACAATCGRDHFLYRTGTDRPVLACAGEQPFAWPGERQVALDRLYGRIGVQRVPVLATLPAPHMDEVPLRVEVGDTQPHQLSN